MDLLKLKQAQWVPLLICLVTIAALCALHARSQRPDRFDFFQKLESITYDWRVKEAARHPSPVSDKLAFVNINDDSIAVFGSGRVGTNFQFGLYWPRQLYGRAIREMKAEGANAIGLDILFDQLRPDHPKVQTTNGLMDSDRFFQIQLLRAGNVVLGSGAVAPHPYFRLKAFAIGDIATDQDADGVLRRARAFRDYRIWHPDILVEARLNHWDLSKADIRTNEIHFADAESNEFVLPVTEDGLFSIADLTHVQARGITRLVPAFEDVRVWHLGLTLAAKELGLDLDKAKVELNKGHILLASSNGHHRIIPVDSKGRFLIDWAVAMDHPKLTRVPFETVVANDILRERGADDLPAPLEGKLVVVGSTATGNDLNDRGATPLADDTFLTSNHWNVMNTLLTGRFIRESPPATTQLLIMMFGLVGGLVTLKLRPIWASGLVVTVVLIYIYSTSVCFVQFRYVLPIIFPAGGLIATHVALLSYQVFFEQGERRRIKQIFTRVVSPKVVDELLKAEKLSLKGTRVEATVFFADVRGFTELTDTAHAQAEEYVRSVGMGPAEADAYFDSQSAQVLQTVNTYLGTIAEVIKQHDGTLDKYIGDCVMAFWGAPAAVAGHALAAVNTAIAAQRAIHALNQERALENKRREVANAERAKRGEPPVQPLKLLTLGTGINTGPMTAGLMGSITNEANFTVFGREVNLAARLETLSGHGRILIGERTYRALLRDARELAASCAELPSVTVKGFRQPVKVYEVPWRAEVVQLETELPTQVRAAA